MASSDGKLNISELDFTKIKENLTGFLSSQAEFVGYNFTGSSFDVLLDIMAYNTHYNSYYANMVANEMFLSSASLRNSVVARAKHLGYRPRSAQGSKAAVTLTITPTDAPASISIPKNTQFQGEVAGVTYIWCTSNSHSVNINANGVYTVADVELTQGIPSTFRYTANTGDSDQKFILPNANTDISTLAVSVQKSASDTETVVYTEASDITTVNSISTVYFIDEVEDGKYEVQFGDGVLGKQLANGNIIILSSLICDAAATNGAKSFSVVSDVGGYSNVKIETASSADGGSIAADIDEIKFNAPKNFDAQNRCVTIHDYVALVKRDYGGAQAVVAWGGEDADPPAYGKVYVAIKPTSGSVLSQSSKKYIQDEILKKRNIVGITPEVVDPDYMYLKVSSTVKYDSGTTTNSASQLKSTVTTAVTDFGNTNLKTFDKSFRYSKLIQAIDAAEISVKSNQTSIQLKRLLYPLLGASGAYTLPFSNQVYHPSNTFWGSVTSSQFSYRDSANTLWDGCRLQDNNGTVEVYRTSGEDRIIVNNNVGSITYLTGKMVLTSFQPIAIGSETTGNTTQMEVYVTPSSSDVNPLREQIILIEPADVTITMLDDAGTGTYVEGTLSTTDGTTLATGY
tara:strand:- start:2979 stop:4856 length:1878 start_codon:yes stop_codon:yes gene_type:complete